MTTRNYKIEYDPEADAAYIRLEAGGIAAVVKETVEVGEDGMQADIDEKGNVVGIEILNFSKRKLAVNELIAKGIENIQVLK